MIRPSLPLEGQNVPEYWIRPEQRLSAEPGMHRFVWDMTYPPAGGCELPLPHLGHLHEHAPGTHGALGPAGAIHGAADGGRQVHTQPLTVKMDPRVLTPGAALQQQFDLSMDSTGDGPVGGAAEDDPAGSGPFMGSHRDSRPSTTCFRGVTGFPPPRP